MELRASNRAGVNKRSTYWRYLGPEMGPRGGDEINLIQRGGNYGWPLYTEGLDYNAEYISIGQDLGLDFAFSETIPPVVDFTPAPSLSNLSFHEGDKFPNGRMTCWLAACGRRPCFEFVLKVARLLKRKNWLPSSVEFETLRWVVMALSTC